MDSLELTLGRNMSSFQRMKEGLPLTINTMLATLASWSSPSRQKVRLRQRYTSRTIRCVENSDGADPSHTTTTLLINCTPQNPNPTRSLSMPHYPPSPS